MEIEVSDLNIFGLTIIVLLRRPHLADSMLSHPRAFERVMDVALHLQVPQKGI